MTGSVALDVVIGLVFIYLLYSLLTTIIQEIIATNILNLRAKILEEAISRMLDDEANKSDDSFSKAFYASPLIKYFGQKKKKKPSYLSSNNFSKVVIDILRGVNPKPGEDFRAKIDQSLSTNGGIGISDEIKLSNGDTFKFLQSLWADAHGDIEKFKLSLEQWFDDTMERASGWYKKRTQFILFFVGLTISIIFNVDTVKIVQKLSNDPILRQQLVQQADAYLKEHPHLKEDLEELKKKNPQGDTLKIAQAKYQEFINRKDSLVEEASAMTKSDIKNLNEILALGWNCENKKTWYSGIIGWILTALALSLGAPFWFDLLNKLMKLRTSISPAPDDKSSSSLQTNGKKTLTIKG